jgi:hypothetical protein
MTGLSPEGKRRDFWRLVIGKDWIGLTPPGSTRQRSAAEVVNKTTVEKRESFSLWCSFHMANRGDEK